MNFIYRIMKRFKAAFLHPAILATLFTIPLAWALLQN